MYPLIAFACVAIFAAGFLFGVWDRRQRRDMRYTMLLRAVSRVQDAYRALLRQLLGESGISNVSTKHLRDSLDAMRGALANLESEAKDFQ